MWHGHLSPSAKKGGVGIRMLGQPSKEHPSRILILFPIYSTTLLSPYVKKLETYFALFAFVSRKLSSQFDEIYDLSKRCCKIPQTKGLKHFMQLWLSLEFGSLKQSAKTLETYFALFIFLYIRTVWTGNFHHNLTSFYTWFIKEMLQNPPTKSLDYFMQLWL